MKRAARRLALLLLAAAVPACLMPEAEKARRFERPNIVVIMADDMGFSDLGCYGSEIRTPAIDRLARGGLRFSQFYNTARCCPTRASLLTGLYPHQAGVGHMMEDRGADGYRGDLNRNCVTIAEALRSAGYHTLMAGKWHVTPAQRESRANWPRARGFERFFGTIHGAGSYYDPVSLVRDDEPIRATEGFFYTDAISDAAVEFVDEYAGRDNPFFLYVAYTSPHWPLHAREAEVEAYRGRYDGGWDRLREERHRRMIAMGVVDGAWPLTPRDERAPAWDDAEHREWQARRMEVYAAQVTCMDRGVGRLIARLEQRGELENTLILFLADNGGCAEEVSSSWKGFHIPEATLDGRPVAVGNDPAVTPGPEETYQSYGLPWANASNTPFRRYKHWVHEGGIATPFIAHWPAVVRRGGEWVREPAHLIDVMATCVDVADAVYPLRYRGREILPMEGTSLLPLLEGRPWAGRDALFWEHEGNRAVRQGKWKLVSRHPGVWELYDLEADRTELVDLAREHPARAHELEVLWRRWADRCGVLPWDEVTGRRSASGAGERSGAARRQSE